MRVCLCLVPEGVGGRGRGLLMFGASVGGGVPAAAAEVRLEAAFVWDCEAAPAELSVLAAGSCLSEASGQEP